MDDTQACPICNQKMRSFHLIDKHVHFIDKTANYIERICIKGAHYIRFFADKATGKIDFIHLALDPKITRYLEIDLVNQKCRINCMKNGVSEFIEIPKMIVPDFPSLEKLKEKINMYVVFS